MLATVDPHVSNKHRRAPRCRKGDVQKHFEKCMIHCQEQGQGGDHGSLD
jgi:hypothetical protein